MAVSTAIRSVSQRLAEGWGEWVKSGISLLGDLKDFSNDHTHTGSPDGTNIPASGLAASAKARMVSYVYGAEANTFTYPVFCAPVQCVIQSVYLTPAANIVGATDNYSTVAALYGSATLCSTASNVVGTWVALTSYSLGTITSGTIAAGSVVTLKKATTGSGVALGVGACFTIYWTPV